MRKLYVIMKIKSYLLISVLLMLSACGGKKEQGVQAEGLAMIEQEWKDIPIKVEMGIDKPTVIQLLRAFNDTWQTAAADSIFAAAAGKDYFVDEWYEGKSPVFVDNEDFCTAWYNHGDTGDQQLECRTYERENGHLLFAVHLEQQNPEQLSFCCFYDYDPKTQMITPEDEPYKDLKRKWQQSYLEYHLGEKFDQTVIVEEVNKDGEACFHHYVWNGMKHEFHHAGPETYANEGDPEGYGDEGDEPWALTEDGVIEDILAYFNDVNETLAEDSGLSPFDLDKKWYTTYWNEVYEAVNEKDGQTKQTEDCFFVDDNHWTAGLTVPVEVKNIKVELQEDAYSPVAEATFTLVEKESGLKKNAIIELKLEGGRYRIDNWLEKSHSAKGSILSQMEKYIGL